jgi:adrenodoxin-NADP+ reductase
MPGIGDVSLEALLERYSAVVLAYGAASNRELSGLWGAKDMKGVHSAREFVNWYNGHPDFVKYNDIFKLDKIRNVVIVGHGNVALDCARILTKRPDELVNSDIAEHALSALRHSTVERVTLVGRRGPVQSAFTIKEFRELTKLEGVHLVTDKTDFDRGMADPDSLAALSVKRPMKRLVDLIGTTVKSSVDYDKSDKKQIVVRYFLSPLGLLSKSALGDTHLPSGAVHPKDASINGRPLGGILDAEGQRTDGTAQSVAAVVCATNEPLPKERVQIKGFHGSGSPSSINECTSIEILPCDLLLTSVGYKSEPVSRNAAIPFDKERHVYTNIEGRISVGESFRSANGTRPLLYAAGWVAQGPTGIIISSIAGAKQTVTSIVKDLAETAARSTPEIPTDNADPADFIRDRMRSAHKAIVEWAGHERVDAEELRRGAEASPTRPRVKVVHSDEMISIANGKTH